MTRLFSTILNMSITASYIALAIIFVRLFLKKAPKIFSYSLWAVVFFRLICPFSFESKLSLMKPQEEIATKANKIINHTPITNNINNLDTTVIEKAVPVPKATVSSSEVIMNIISIIWIIGVASLLIYSIISYVKLKRKLATATIVKDNIYETDRIKTPFVLGFIKPKIYIPNFINNDELDYILKHEQTHIKRFDYIVKPIAFFIVIIHWFNPVMWLSYYLMVKDLELSCDESVMKKYSEDIRSNYSNSLLSLSVKQSGLLTPLAFGENNSKSRIKNVLSYKKPTLWIIIVGVVVVAVVWIGFLTNPKTVAISDNKETTKDKQTKTINLDSNLNLGSGLKLGSNISLGGDFNLGKIISDSLDSADIASTIKNDIGKEVVVKETTISAKDSKNITDFQIDWIIGDISVVKTDSKEIKIIETGNKEIDESEKFTYKLTDSGLLIEDKNSKAINLKGEQRKKAELDLEIFLPEKDYSCFVTDVIDGAISFADLNINQVSNQAINGSIIIDNMGITDLNVECENGTVDVKNSTISNVINVDTINGEIDLRNNPLPETLKCSTINGVITALIPENDGFKYKKSSGGFCVMNCDFDVKKENGEYVYKDGSKLLDLSCVNGVISILKS